MENLIVDGKDLSDKKFERLPQFSVVWEAKPLRVSGPAYYYGLMGNNCLACGSLNTIKSTRCT